MGCRDAYSVVERNGKIRGKDSLSKELSWYQGEANTPILLFIKKLFPAMVSQWRNFFHNAEMPFYYIQIAP
ncbi:hypothetical protein NXW47_25600 [Bacteroides thetaiotaomicron]|uniref:hypothetical protein n=1 Tax=Bacteroides thetaiotaomicron TaxID=818 RepID=UPI0021652379|nr:hypothetical protein [Bacteroides thetaiotaomicron]MCS2468187.1 hypothetical protein [Bacteroides thetaiotaomicron]